MNVGPKIPRCLQSTVRRKSLHGLSVKEKGSSSQYEADASFLTCPANSGGKKATVADEKKCSQNSCTKESKSKSSSWTKMFEAISAAKKGELHLFLNEGGLNELPVSRVQMFFQKCAVLNQPEVLKNVLLREETDARVCPFFQKYLFEHSGFAFESMTERGARQKQILKDILNQSLDDERFHIDVNKLKASLVKEAETSVDEGLRQCLGDMISRLYIGEPFGGDDADKNAVWELADLIYTIMGMETELRTLPFLRHLPGKYGNAFKEAVKKREKLKETFFESQKVTFREGHVRGLIDACLQIQADDRKCGGESQLTDKFIQGIMFDALLAGLTEMLKSLRMLVFLMCHFEHVQTRVRTEIDEVLAPGELPTFESRHNMPYTQAVIFEVLRYSSQTPLAIPHRTSQDISVDSHVLHKDTLIFPNLWGIHHDEATWGDPWNFRPERFLDDRGQLLPETHKCRTSFLPFVIGTRKCPGESFAMFRLYVIFTSLLRDLTFSPPCDEELPPVDPRLYNNKYPLYLPKFKCRVTER